MTQSSATQQGSEQAADKDAIRPFHVSIPEEPFVDLRRRIAATRWPEKETVADQPQGVQLAKLKELVRYWGHGLRLAEGRGEAERLPAVHDDHRRLGHSLHPRPLPSPERDAADHYARVAFGS